MAAKYITVSSTPTTLIEKNANNTATQYTGLISTIRISNNHATDDSIINLWLEGDLDYDIIKRLVIPAGVAFEMDNVSFNVNTHKLMISYTGGEPLTVRIE